jgi:hypothetical protein
MVAVSAFMSGVTTSLTNGFEMMLAHLCNINSRPPGPMFPIYIDMPRENRRRWKHVRFYYGSCFQRRAWNRRRATNSEAFCDFN